MAVRHHYAPESWVDRHGDVLFRYALVRVRDHSVAEELVQEALLAALQSYESFSGQSSERTWLIGILKHKIIDHYRRLSRMRQFNPDDEVAFEHDELFQQSGEWGGHWNLDLGPGEWAMSPDRAVEKSEFWVILSHCLMELPERTAAAFTLREVEQLSTEEICKVLDVSAANLWVMLHRARMHLRNCLQVKWFGKTLL
jgi:RNA polymerase sigma-70 factor (ECF subfamily)